MSSDLTALWNELEGSATAPGITVRRFHASAPVDIFVGVENPGKTRLLFVEASEAALAGSGATWPQSAGVVVAVESGAKQHTRARVAVRLTVPAYRDVFSVLVGDLLGSLESAQTESAAVRAFRERLERWQRLLARHGPEGLSVPEQHGLYGELLFIRDFMLPAATPEAVLGAWTGPLAKDQDFQLSRCSVEVKVSSGNPHHQIHVSNVRQLDEAASASGALFLFHAALEVRHQQGETLVALVDELRRAFGPLRFRFDDLLQEAGYLDIHASAYLASGYAVKRHRFFAVSNGFPRIREAELRAGVGDVRYTVQLGACEAFAVPDASVIDLIRESQ
jgi:hypothetical protein